jgi:hypothetical protein
MKLTPDAFATFKIVALIEVVFVLELYGFVLGVVIVTTGG